jgi:ABC-type Mn2+/Zn2+ transport system permease subunit
MFALENLIVRLLLLFFTPESINTFLRDPQHTAIIIGTMIAIAGALLGTFLLLRGMALTSDAISHTVLLGIVVAFMLMTGVSSTWNPIHRRLGSSSARQARVWRQLCSPN